MTFFTTPTWEPKKSRCALKYTQKEPKIKSTKYNFSDAHLVVALKILLDNLFADDWYVDHLNYLNIAQNKHEIEKKILTNTLLPFFIKFGPCFGHFECYSVIEMYPIPWYFV